MASTPPTSKPPSVSGAVGKFAAAGLVAAALLAVASFLVVRGIATGEAVRDAQRLTQVAARGVVAPALTHGVIEGRPNALARFDRRIRGRVARGSVVRVKIWKRDGTIIYSDEPRLIGQRFDLEGDKLAAFGGGAAAAEAEVSELSRPENRFDPKGQELLEVYEPITGPGGEPLLFEAYLRYDSVAQDGTQLWLIFALPIGVALLLLALLQLPLAASLARRIQRGHVERERLLVRAVDASDRERRRIAGDIHDGLVQQLSGTSYSLSATAQGLRQEGRTDAGDAVAGAAEQVRRSVRELRSLLIEIYPPSLERAGLEAALTDLTVPLEARGLDAQVHVDPAIELSRDSEALAFRVAQEAVRNAAEHSGADHLEVQVQRSAAGVQLVVKDDGQGFDQANGAPPAGGGHMGLALLQDLAEDSGAQLDVASVLGTGTTVTLTLPKT
ncbi:MAG: two-component system, NarL family, sensor kinase [Thermoleophilaceae bacterium]|nr:two-component system, NarL family, sensor kinase [Thermoleophilaceae bacterium]